MIKLRIARVLALVGALAQLARSQTPFCSKPVQCGDLAAFPKNLDEISVPGGPVVFEEAPADTCSYGLPALGLYATACAADVEPKLYCVGSNKIRVKRRGDPGASMVFRMVAYCLYGLP